MSSFPKRFLHQVGTLLAVNDASNSKISSRVDDCNCFRRLAQAYFSVLMSSGMITWKKKIKIFQFTINISQITRNH
jgi:hypothetical protein